ncbi:hypothetical protein [Clostridium guangxiense]|uniref:hypothetical protein n=1 Tax=Clostridium guangxiense TaxID=1662055 RepID=UPI001E55617E|nr:hypothetical protein [Clostridium guangxiense]MCD2346231.1 hypothetical protein [Clostridium guangxiense]
MDKIFLITIGLLFILMIVIVLKPKDNFNKDSNDNTDKVNKDKVTPIAIGCTYIGGCPKILDSHIEGIVIKRNSHNLILHDVFKGDILLVPINSIKSITVQSKEQISQRVTISRLIALGVFAFGVPKKEKNITKYIVINYINDKNENEDIVIEHKNVPIVAERLHKIIPELN